MASFVYCDRVRHIVEESRSDVAGLIEAVKNPNLAGSDHYGDFIYLTPVNGENQIALRACAITSFQGLPGDGI